MPRPASPQIHPDDLHWLAGLLEGEGTFLAGPPSQPRTPALVVHMADRDVVERVARLLGTTVQPVAPQQAHRPTYVARLRGRRAVAWMRLLPTLMAARRRAQIARALASHGPDPRRLLDDRRATDALVRLAAGDSVADVADHLGVTVWSVYDLRAGRSYRHLDRELARLVGAVLRAEREGAYAHLTPTPAAAPAAGR